MKNRSHRLFWKTPLVFAVCLLGFNGAGSSQAQSLEGLEPPPEFVQKAVELVRLRQYVREIEEENRAAVARLPQTRQELKDLEEKEARLKQQAEEMLNPDRMVFKSVKAMADAASQTKDPRAKSEAAAAARRFMRDYPTSELLAEAQTIQRTLDAGAAAAREAAERARLEEERRKKEVAKQWWELFRSGKMNIMQMKKYLRTRSKADILKMMGRPSRQKDHWTWIYKRAWVVDPQGKPSGVTIMFEGDRVLNVGYAQ